MITITGYVYSHSGKPAAGAIVIAEAQPSASVQGDKAYISPAYATVAVDGSLALPVAKISGVVYRLLTRDGQPLPPSYLVCDEHADGSQVGLSTLAVVEPPGVPPTTVATLLAMIGTGAPAGQAPLVLLDLDAITLPASPEGTVWEGYAVADSTVNGVAVPAGSAMYAVRAGGAWLHKIVTGFTPLAAGPVDPPPPTGPTLVTPAAPTFTDADGTVSDTYTIPTTTGVTYRVGLDVKAAGTYSAAGTVTVTAVPQAGYAINAGAATEWTRTYSTSGAWATIVSDTFTAPDDTLLIGHTTDSGMTWVADPAGETAEAIKITGGAARYTMLNQWRGYARLPLTLIGAGGIEVQYRHVGGYIEYRLTVLEGGDTPREIWLRVQTSGITMTWTGGAPVTPSGSPTGVAAGDTVRWRVVGMLIECYVNDTFRASWLISGSAGTAPSLDRLTLAIDGAGAIDDLVVRSYT